MLMAADVSTLVRMMGSSNRYGSSKEGEKKGSDMVVEGERDLVTRDLLGGGAPLGPAKELDPDLKAPAGWEKRLDLVSGEVFFQGSPAAAAAASMRRNGGLQDLNFPPPPSLELKLFPLSSSSSSSSPLPPPFPPADYQSVCTLDKVKSALDRLKHPANASTSPTSSSTTTASAKRRPDDEDGDGESGSSVEELEPPAGPGGGAMVAAGCPSCLSYVLVPGSNPRCPRCGMAVPTASKRRRLDLNLSAASGGVEG